MIDKNAGVRRLLEISGSVKLQVANAVLVQKVVDKYTYTVAALGLVMIAVNHGAAELVMDSVEQVDVINSK